MKKIGKGLKLFFIPIVIIIFTLVVLFPSFLEKVDFSGYNNQNVLDHIRYLSSPELKGRLAGEDSNEKAIEYVVSAFKSYGLKPIEAIQGYEQPFEAIVPDIEKDATFQVHFNAGGIRNYKQFTDYRMYTFGNAGTADFDGEMVFVGYYLFKTPKEKLKDRIAVVSANDFSDDMREYLMDAEVAGLLIYYGSTYGIDDSDYQKMKSTSFSNKVSPTIPMAVISRQMYLDLKEDAALKPFDIDGTYQSGSVFGVISQLEWTCNISYPLIATANVLGVLPGKKDEYIIICGHLDHVGEGNAGEYFPGAMDNASGVAMMLELARLSSLQKVKPDKTIIFAAWNAEENGLKGSEYYVNHPLFSLEKSEVFNMDMIGGYRQKELMISGLNVKDTVLASRYVQYAESLGFEPVFDRSGGSDHVSFSDKDVPAVMLSQGHENYHKVTDTIENIDPVTLGQNGALFTHIFEKDIFNEFSLDFMKSNERFLVGMYFFGLLMIYSVDALQKSGNVLVKGSIIVEKFFYSPYYQLLKRIYSFLTPVVLLMLFLGVLTQLPKDLNFIQTQGGQLSNFSPYLTVKKVVLYYRGFFEEGFGTTFRGGSAFQIIARAFTKSGKLLLFSLIFAIPIGIIKGFFDVYGGKTKRGLRAFGSIVLLSIPDLLWILIGFFIIVYIGKQESEIVWLQGAFLRGWLAPWITLSILPVVYISRIALVAAEEELGKPYIRALRAKGLSKMRIYSWHLTKPVLIKVFDSLASLTTIMISNLILIEYLFDYKGIVNNILIYSYNDDVNTFIGLVLSLGFLFVICLVVFKGTSFLMNPKKQEVRS